MGGVTGSGQRGGAVSERGTEWSRPTLAPGRFVELPGRGRTFVRERGGPAEAPVIVLLHGWTATAALNWAPSFAPLSDRFRVIALDHRGHGRGLRSRRPFRLEDCADDVAALLAAVGIERCIAVGYSMGGPIAQLLWQRHPGWWTASCCARRRRGSTAHRASWSSRDWPPAGASSPASS